MHCGMNGLALQVQQARRVCLDHIVPSIGTRFVQVP
jgi:hypothetical protein